MLVLSLYKTYLNGSCFADNAKSSCTNRTSVHIMMVEHFLNRTNQQNVINRVLTYTSQNACRIFSLPFKKVTALHLSNNSYTLFTFAVKAMFEYRSFTVSLLVASHVSFVLLKTIIGWTVQLVNTEK